MTASEKNVSAATLRNPRIEKDSSLDAGQKVTWDCIYFGSYLNIYADNQLSKKLETTEIKTVKAGEIREISVQYNTKDMKFDASQNAYCSMQVTANDKDSNVQNDFYYGVVYRWELPGQNNISDCTVLLENDRYTPDGTAKTPEVTVKRGDLLLIKGTDYDVKYQNNINAGTATVVITGKNRYKGTIEKKFQIGSGSTTGSDTTKPGTSKPADSANDSGKKPSKTEKVQKITKISIKGKKTIKSGKTLKLKAKIKASKGANKKLLWTSSNTRYADVSSTGKVKVYKAGKKKTVVITAMATDGSGKKARVKVKIK